MKYGETSILLACFEYIKIKDKEALFNVAFETDNISSVELLLRHNKYPYAYECCFSLLF